MSALPPLESFAPLASTPEEALQSIFSFPSFREGQRDVIDAVIARNDTLVVMPTGSGKSLCYMVPACVLPGLVVVVSPLIALMKDQSDALDKFGIPATYINSSLSWPEQQERLIALKYGAFKLVLVAPERFKSQAFMEAISALPVGLFAIDEAHCISSWGHDFRPDYLTLGKVREDLGTPTTLALTATATPEVQQDIARQLGFEEPEIIVSGFARPNLFFEVYSARSRAEKLERLVDALHEYGPQGSTVIYCATRRQVEEVAGKVIEAGFRPALYHAGLSDTERDEVQDAFMASDAPLLIATNAFGMGVDKSDVRLIVHFNIPGSVEAYYQEAGRAGRDGDRAHCLLLYNRNDRGIHEFFTDNSYPPREILLRIWRLLQRLGEGPHMLDAEMLADQLSRGGERVHPWAVASGLRLLERGGHLAFGVRSSTPWLNLIDQPRETDLRIDFDELQRRRAIAARQLDQMTHYATGAACRQSYLVRYFSSAGNQPQKCGHCDACCGIPDYSSRAIEKIGISDDLVILIKKLLSGVARARGYWGTHAVAAMLRGSKAKKILNSSLAKVSTYGLLEDLRQDDLVLLLDLLNQLALTTQDTHGRISLTAEGTELMTSSEPLPTKVERTFEAYITPQGSPSSPRPPRGSTNGSSTTAVGNRSSHSGADTYQRTLRLHREGHSIDAIASERGVTTSTVLRHFLVLASQGYDLNLEEHKDGLVLPHLRELAKDWKEGDPLSPLKEALPASCNYQTLKLNLAILIGERNHDERAD